MRRHRTELACMVRRRSTVRFRNGAPLKGQVRSSLDSSHPTLRMGAVTVLGGIWEVVSRPTDIPADSLSRQNSSGRPRGGQPGDAGLHGGNRKPAVPSHWDTHSTAVSPGGHTDTRLWRRSSRILSRYSELRHVVPRLVSGTSRLGRPSPTVVVPERLLSGTRELVVSRGTV
jgi:hypothetical protein